MAMNVTAHIKPVQEADFLSKHDLIAYIHTYNPSVNADVVARAYDMCKQSHKGQKRHSGEAYYGHPVAVAGILANLRMDTYSICTALLHDVLEDTDMSEDEMRAEFGDIIKDLVVGVTKLGKLELSSTQLTREAQQAENFQKFVLAMSKDIRVLIVKLCDRLHNMRTLEHHPKQSSRERIARETMEIYAPLARKIGVEKICAELEDLSFKYINPSAFETIETRLAQWRDSQKTAVSELSTLLRDLMSVHYDDVRVLGREKRPYAIWKKLQRQGISFEDVADIYAFRIIVADIKTCYEALGHIHTEFRCVANRFRDFISVPKPNGYQSLQTTILGPDNQRVEIQIRTEEMNDIAERGIAAHWNYKDNSYDYDFSNSSDYDPLNRIRHLVEMMEHGGAADEFLEYAKLEMFADQVFTFTPKGELIALPQGATPLDFAYAVHTKVGDTCIGAIINNQKKPLRTRLKNGDVVKIIRGGTPGLNSGWENMVVTGKARSALRRLARVGENEELRDIGFKLADHAFARENKALSESVLEDALKRLNYEVVEDLYVALGRGKLGINDFMNGVFPGRSEQVPKGEVINRNLIDNETARIYVRGDGLREGVSMHIGECCYPILGDRIVGIHTPDRGIVIHTIDCDCLEALEDQPELWIDLYWRKSVEKTVSVGQIAATIEHVPGALAAITGIIGEASGNVSNIKILKRSPSFFDLVVDIEVTDTRHLSQIIAAMRASAYVVDVRRARADV